MLAVVKDLMQSQNLPMYRANYDINECGPLMQKWLDSRWPKQYRIIVYKNQNDIEYISRPVRKLTSLYLERQEDGTYIASPLRRVCNILFENKS